MAASYIIPNQIDLSKTESKYITPIAVWLTKMGRSTIVNYVDLDWVLVDWFKGLKDGAVVIRTIAEFIHYDKLISCHLVNCLSFYFATPIVNCSIVAASYRLHDDDHHDPSTSIDDYTYWESSSSSSSSSSSISSP
jgi:hypothetical protein